MQLLFRTSSYFIVLFVVLLSKQVQAQDLGSYVQIAPMQDWVSPVAAFDIENYQEGGDNQNVKYRVIDYQINSIDPADVATYYMREYELLTSNGVQDNSRIEISYDPVFESIHLHEVVVWREGKVLDKLESSNIRIIQQEQDLESLIYNGDETISILLSDIRRGDVVRYSFTRFGSNPIFDQNREYTISTQFGSYVGRYFVRLLSDENAPFHVRRFHSESEITETVSDGVIEYVLDIIDAPLYRYEDGTPTWRETRGRIVFSDFKNWSDVIEWVIPMYERVAVSSPEIKAIAKQLTEEHGTKEDSRAELIGAALQWVQEEVRYFGVELGQNSHQPSLPTETLSRRYGDCKDKTVLLISILNELGIEAEPALVDTDMWLLADDDPNRLHAFDHVIVHVKHDGQSHWIDGTGDVQQGKLGEFSESDYGKALIVKEGEDSLTEMNEIDKADVLKVAKEITIHSSFDGSASMKVITDREGELAEYIRVQISNEGLKRQQEYYDDFYRDYFPSLVSSEPLQFDEEAGNKSTVVESYEIGGFWDPSSSGSNYRWLYADDIYSKLDSPEDAYVRKFPYQIDHPVNIVETIVLDVPWTLKNKTSKKSERNEYFEIERSITSSKKDGQISVKVAYKSLAFEVPADKMKSFAESIERAKDIAAIYVKEGGVQVVDTEMGDKLTTFLRKYGLWMYIFMICAFLYAFLEWVFEPVFNKNIPQGIFYPVSKIKFFVLMVCTIGIYGAYWFYKNFRYLKSEGAKVIPILRALFNVIFYYSLFQFVIEKTEGERKKGLSAIWLGFMAIAYLIATVASSATEVSWFIAVPGVLICILLLFPILKKINKENGVDSAAYRHNSRWRIRHYVLLIPLLLGAVMLYASESNFTPVEKLLAGDDLRDFQRRYIADIMSLQDGEEIEYFYSDDTFDYRLDGNGYTNDTLFSYWQNDDGSIAFKRKARSELLAVDVSVGEDIFESSTITLTFSDQSTMIWNGPAEVDAHKKFVEPLRQQIQLR